MSEAFERALRGTGLTASLQPLKAIPSAITVITAKELEQRGITQIEQLFRGDVPGIFALHQGSSQPLDQVAMFSRGASALSYASAGTSSSVGYTTNAIKTYIDGIEMADPSYLSQIDPRNIERIEILTGPQASTIYGSNAVNGRQCPLHQLERSTLATELNPPTIPTDIILVAENLSVIISVYYRIG